MPSGFLFFAYGDMASKTHMESIHPGCELMGPSKLPHFRIAFTTAGHANLLHEVGAKAWGTLWIAPAQVLAEMDVTAAAKNQERSVLHVTTPAGIVAPATTYYNATLPEGFPAPLVLAGAIQAARSMGLDRRYLRRLLAMER